MWQKKWILGNWKMNGNNEFNRNLLNSLVKCSIPSEVQVVIAPPFPYIMQASEILSDTSIMAGSQDCSSFAKNGAYTGEVSAEIIADCGAKFVLIGHSERRSYFNETNSILLKKIQNALELNLIPVFCIGETLEDRENGREKQIIAEQLSIFNDLSIKNIVLAYEPVWAIGTGKTATVEQIVDMHSFISNNILSLLGKNANIRTLYGGSVNAANAEDILSLDFVDGALVGGASLKFDSFEQIINSVRKN